MKTTIAAIALFAALAASAQEPAESVLDDVAEETAAEPAPAAEPETPAAPATEPAPAAAEPAPTSPTPPTSPTSPQPTAEPAPSAPSSPSTAATTDEIDLEEIDDSALAAARPQVTAKDADGPVTLVDIDCDDATLADVLRQFRKTTGANIISTDSTNLLKRVSATLRRVPWFQALTEILNARGFRLDERDGVYRVVEDRQVVPLVTKTFQLNHASAKELAELFNASYGVKGKDGKTVRKIATCFESANVVVVTADEKTISDCVAIVKAIDHAVAQIYIEARFLELSSQALHKLGMDWSTLSSWGVSVRNLQFGGEMNSGRLADYGVRKEYTRKAMTQTGSTTTTSAESSTDSSTFTDLADGSYGIGKSVVTPTDIKAAEGAGRSAASMGWANAMGFSGQLSADDFRLALSAFEQFGEGKIFSNPKIIVSNGKAAKVDMTTKEPNVTVDANYTGTSSQNLSVSTKLEVIPGEDKQMFAKEAFFSYGIELTVKPRISPDGLISVEIVPTISEKSGEKKVEGADSAAPYTTYPIINVKRLTTEFTMKDGSTAVIGGLTQTVEDDVDSGIPYLRRLPWIGQKLFGWKSRQKVQKEILICVTVGIANPAALPKDIGLPKNAVMGREYVNGTRLEPGDRPGSATEALTLDTNALDDRRESGRVSVTISK